MLYLALLPEIQYPLSPEGDRIIGETILDRGHTAFHEPTTSAFVNNQLYGLANNHLARYNSNKESTGA